MAWARTAAAMLLNALLTLRAGIAGESTALTALACALLAAAMATYAIGRTRARGLAAGTAPMQAPPWALRAVAASVVAAGVTGMVISLSSRGSLL